MADLPVLFSEQIVVFAEGVDLVVFADSVVDAVPVIFADSEVDADLVVVVVPAVFAEPVVLAVPADTADSWDSSAPDNADPGDIAHRSNRPEGIARSDSNSDYTVPADICSAGVCVLPAEL
ncbi:MAG: hypothetical protein ACI4Q5_06405 [Porcipelethomonas sp.]